MGSQPSSAFAPILEAFCLGWIPVYIVLCLTTVHYHYWYLYI